MDLTRFAAQAKAFIAARFGGDNRAAFDAYAENGVLTTDSIIRFLTEANISYSFFRPTIARIAESRFGNDGGITWEQVQAAQA